MESSNLASPTPRKLSMLRVPLLAQQRQGGPAGRPQIQRTSLSSVENSNAIEAWETLVHESYLTQMADLEQLLHSLQIPLQPISLRACQEEFQRSKGRFSFRDFISLLERLKTLHGKWMHKLRGKLLDDDLLEAFVAVGGQSDSNGEVDLSKMRAVVGEFQLNVDLDKIIAEMDNDGSANIDFGEFASLIRDSASTAGGSSSSKHKSPPRHQQPQKGNDDDDDDLFNMDSLEDAGSSSPGIGGGGAPAPITLSSMMYVDEDLDQALLFPPLGLTSRKQEPGELSTRKRSELNLLTHRKKSMMMLHGGTSGENTPHGGAVGALVGGTAAVNAAHGGETKTRLGNKASSSPSRSTRTRLAQVHVGSNSSQSNSEKSGGGATAFYKGGGGLRNLTPAPGALASKHAPSEGNAPSRSHSSMSSGNATTTSPLRGTVRASKKHKFAN
jgi:Ca2+-binding EF-hand superfamily protein